MEPILDQCDLLAFYLFQEKSWVVGVCNDIVGVYVYPGIGIGIH